MDADVRYLGFAAWERLDLLLVEVRRLLQCSPAAVGVRGRARALAALRAEIDAILLPPTAA
jgi:hypothetical protein